MTPGFRLKIARKQLKMTQQKLADKLSERSRRMIKRNVVAMWESDKNAMPAECLLLAAEILNKNPNWLLFGTEPMEALHIEGLVPALMGVKKIPLMSYKQMGSDSMETSFYIGIDYALATAISEESIALQVEDTSMLPALNRDDIIVIDPKVRPHPGEIIVVKIKSTGKIILGKYRPCEAKFNDSLPVFEVVPINPDWPNTKIENESQGKIMGTLVEHRCRRRSPPLESHYTMAHTHKNQEPVTN